MRVLQLPEDEEHMIIGDGEAIAFSGDLTKESAPGRLESTVIIKNPGALVKITAKFNSRRNRDKVRI